MTRKFQIVLFFVVAAGRQVHFRFQWIMLSLLYKRWFPTNQRTPFLLLWTVIVNTGSTFVAPFANASFPQIHSTSFPDNIVWKTGQSLCSVFLWRVLQHTVVCSRECCTLCSVEYIMQHKLYVHSPLNWHKLAGLCLFFLHCRTIVVGFSASGASHWQQTLVGFLVTPVAGKLMVFKAM